MVCWRRHLLQSWDFDWVWLDTILTTHFFIEFDHLSSHKEIVGFSFSAVSKNRFSIVCMLRWCSTLILPKTTISSTIPMTPLHLSNLLSILVWKTSWAILRLKGMRLNLYLPNVVRLIDSLHTTTFRYTHFASPIENTLASVRFSKISFGVKTTWCSIWIQQ